VSPPPVFVGTLGLPRSCVQITLAVNFGTTLFLIGCINVFQDDQGNGIFADATAWQTYLIFLAITALCVAISVLGNRWLHILDVRCSFFILPRLF
jgi:hypothetical protein